MIPREILELAIIAFIVIGIGVAIWKGGAQNPVGTGGLDRRLRTIGTKVGEIEGRVEHMERTAATADDVKRLERMLREHQSEVSASFEKLGGITDKVDANKRGIDAINERMPAIVLRQSQMAEDVAGIAASLKHTSGQVERLYNVLIEKGLQK